MLNDFLIGMNGYQTDIVDGLGELLSSFEVKVGYRVTNKAIVYIGQSSNYNSNYFIDIPTMTTYGLDYSIYDISGISVNAFAKSYASPMVVGGVYSEDERKLTYGLSLSIVLGM